MITIVIVAVGVRIVFILLDKLPKHSGYDLAALIIIFLALSLLVTLVKPDFFKNHVGTEGGMYREDMIESIAV